MPAWNFQNAIVPVTGAASGIGLAICRRLREEGATPLMLDVDAGRLGEAVKAVYGQDADASRYAYVLDVRSAEDTDACFARIHHDHGRITHAVSNAGISAIGHILELEDEQWQRVIDINLSGAMYTCRAASRFLAEQKSGAIVNIASIAGFSAKRSRIAYASSKAGVINLTRAMAMDLGEHGVRVNAVAPGLIETPMHQMNPKEYAMRVSARTALKRMGTADEIANPVLFLLSDLASYISGQTLVVDGALTATYA